MKLITYLKLGSIFIIKSPIVFIKYFLLGLKSLIITLPALIINKSIYIIKKEKTSKQIFSLSIITLSFTTYLISIFILTRWYVQTERNKKFINSLTEQINLLIEEENTTNEYNDTNAPTTTPNINQEIEQSPPNKENILNYKPTYTNINLNYYINKNKDTVGWIKIDNTKVNYPIVQSTNNTYYLDHDFYNTKTSIGWIYADYRNNFDIFNNNTIIYGHNLIDQYMFGILPTFLNKDWLNKPEQHYIKISTKNTNSIWQIFSVYTIEPITDYLQTNFYSLETYETFLNTITNRSVHKLNINVSSTDKILTLSTCDNTGKRRVVIHAKLIQIKDK